MSELATEQAIVSGLDVDCWKMVQMALEIASDPSILNCSNILLIGPPGCGKSYAALHQGLQPGQGCHSATLTEDMPSVELRGHQIIDANSTVYIDLMAAQAMKKGDRLVLNEISKGGPDMHSFLLGVLDNRESSFMEIPKLVEASDGSKVCEIIRPKEGFHVVATSNDPANRLQPALRDRFPIIIECNTVAPGALKRLHEDLQGVAEKFVMHKDKSKRIGMRKWLAFDELIQKVGYDDAYRLIFGKDPAFGDELQSALKILKGTPGEAKAKSA
jgi:midasin (ATPase involved in ribosome maturation)